MGRPCGCNCIEFETPDLCTGCMGQDLRGNSATIGVDLSGLTWGLSTQNDCSDSYVDAFFRTVTTDWQTRTKSLSNAGAGIVLQVRPAEPSGWPSGQHPMRIGAMFDNADQCVWYWEDSTGINDRVKSSPATHQVINTYTPTAADPASYWYREPQVYSVAADCGPSSGWTCGHAIYGNAVSLELVLGPATGSTWNNVSGPAYWWLLRIWVAGVYRRIVTSTGFGGPNGVRGFGGQSVGTLGVLNPSGPCMEFWDSATSDFYTFGNLLNYAKRIDCETDFGGGPITLAVDPYLKSRADAIGVTYPSTCQITL